MENSYLKTSGVVVDNSQAADTQVKETGSHLRALIIPAAIGTSIAVAGIFIVLAAVQVLPHGVNAISSWGVWGYVAGGIAISGGVITVIIGLVLHFRHKPAKNSIGDQEFERFRDYKKGEDKAYAHALGTSFFYYDCDTVNDRGWGCAWRCIQICASSVNLFPSFQALYSKYRRNPTSQTEWAEPGYGKRYLDDEGVPNQLILYNMENGTKKTPTDLCTKIKDFDALRDQLILHFNTYATPVMADDIDYALTIVGIRVTSSDETILFIADPHKLSRKDGLYYVVLDHKGNQITTTGVDNGSNGASSVKKAHFNKGWMLLFPQPKR